nr:MAG TPA: hypothetical protein [Caudoviricetes sp.]
MTNASSICKGWCGLLLPVHDTHYTQVLSKSQ